jgi:hypothetical protein
MIDERGIVIDAIVEHLFATFSWWSVPIDVRHACRYYWSSFRSAIELDRM